MEKVVLLVLGKRLNTDGSPTKMLCTRLDSTIEVQSPPSLFL